MTRARKTKDAIDQVIAEMKVDAEHVVYALLEPGQHRFKVRRVPLNFQVGAGHPLAGWVYFVMAGDRVKIGYAKNVDARLASLRTGSSVPLTVLMALRANPTRERELHDKFATLRVQGEWFRLDGALLDFLEGYYQRQKRERER